MPEDVKESNPTETRARGRACARRGHLSAPRERSMEQQTTSAGVSYLCGTSCTTKIAHKRLLPTLDWLFFSLCASSTTRQAHSMEPSTAWSIVISS